ncbi:MAG TPA: GtrA family protein [Rubrivivax sp.]|jgi:putative flippase GtrA|nr:GtrA family protein [Rubrivivax sp.]
MNSSRREARMLSGFLLVGSVGFLVDAGLLTMMVAAGSGPYLGRAVSFPVAVVTTFLLNRHLTFQASGTGNPGLQFVRYLGAQLGGTLLNLAVYVALLAAVPAWSSQPWIPLAIGSIVAMALTYLSSRVIFRA